MPENGRLTSNVGTNRRMLGHASASSCFLVALLLLIGPGTAAVAQQLPPGGKTSWVIQGPEEIVTFVLFDPKAPGVSLPAGLRFISARDAEMPEVQEYLKELATYHADKTNVIARDRSKKALKCVRELMREDRELSAVARACILSSGDPRVTGILQSA